MHTAPGVARDIKAFFEGAKLVAPADWPPVAKTLLAFIRKCNDNPDDLAAACAELGSSPYGRGFQTGTLSPILNALHPDRFLIINSKPRQTIAYFTGKRVDHTVAGYPEANTLGLELIGGLPALEALAEEHGVHAIDVFDTFSHWLVAEKKFDFKEPQYWKIAPGKEAEFWDECREGGYISVGWGDTGDLSSLSRKEFDARRDHLVATKDGWTKQGANQAWRLARQVREGDFIVANRATGQVVGLGIVSGPYYYVPDIDHGHRVPVEWYDVGVRDVQEKNWRRTILKLDHDTFERVASAPANYEVGPEEPDRVVADQLGNMADLSDIEPHPNSLFSRRTFELFEGLYLDPTQSYYSAHKSEFQQHVIDPFRDLMKAVAAQLPAPILEAMETESRIFAKIPKNDWGRGGAWDFYWGAFYPRGGKRIDGAQLYLWMNHVTLRAGFGLGHYSSEHGKRFRANLASHRESLPSVLRDVIRNPELRFGDDSALSRSDPDAPRDILPENWLDQAQTADVEISLPLTRAQVLSTSFDELRDKITDTYVDLFPLVLLATSDRPLAAIAEYEGDDAADDEEPNLNPEFTLEECAEVLSFEPLQVAQWIRALNRKGQAVFYGPPGTGKTYVARHLVKHLIGGTDGITDLVQFHPAYAYEDFMQGIRPKSDGGGALSYPIVPGRFMDFCSEAKRREGPCVLIIDEINRANLARVFGELMYLLEYRGERVPLAGGRDFEIPANVRIIGTINRADRSIALVDHALRRRFAFIALFPQYDVLRRFHTRSDFPVDQLVHLLEQLNGDIGDPNYWVGISFFLHSNLSDHLEDIWKMEIEPYLEEYFFDQEDRVKRYRWDEVRGRLQG